MNQHIEVRMIIHFFRLDIMLKKAFPLEFGYFYKLTEVGNRAGDDPVTPH